MSLILGVPDGERGEAIRAEAGRDNCESVRLTPNARGVRVPWQQWAAAWAIVNNEITSIAIVYKWQPLCAFGF